MDHWILNGVFRIPARLPHPERLLRPKLRMGLEQHRMMVLETLPGMVQATLWPADPLLLPVKVQADSMQARKNPGPT
jgi:hypothetical protein